MNFVLVLLFHLDKMICFSIKSINTFLSYFHIIKYDDFSVWFIKSNEWRSVLWVDDRRESLWTCLLQEINKSFIFIRYVLKYHSEEDENWFELNEERSSVILKRKTNVCSIKKMFVKVIWFSSNSRKFFIIDSINWFWMNVYWMSNKSSSNSMIICSRWFYEFPDVVLVFQDWNIR